MGSDNKPDDSKKMEVLKGLIKDLHDGEDMAVLKKRFADLVKDVGPDEIPRLEQQLMREGMPQHEIEHLCDVHVELFKESLDRQEKLDVPPGHPVHTLSAENRALGNSAEEFIGLLDTLGSPPSADNFPELAPDLGRALSDMSQVEKHYLKKENQLFPFLEKHDITGPTQVMWTIHDQVRLEIKHAKEAMNKSDLVGLSDKGRKAARMVLDMIYKEEKILLPMSLKTLEESEWVEIRRGEPDIGYALIVPGDEWEPGRAKEKGRSGAEPEGELIDLDAGRLSPEVINHLFKNLTVDITFVDANDEVRYFSQGKERIFPRSPGIIGRKVQMCHPPKSVHVVERILEEFKAGTKNEAEFWIQLKGKFLLILYRAIRDDNGGYLGTMEISQDITKLRKLEGEQRLSDWEEK